MDDCFKQKTDAQWQSELTPEQFRVARKSGTERPFQNAYWNHQESGCYCCVCCGAELFASDTKFDSGTGWPSFWEPATDASVETHEERTLFLGRRTEVRCSRCDAHLGHRFPDGPPPTGQRYCMNSAALRFLSTDTSPE